MPATDGRAGFLLPYVGDQGFQEDGNRDQRASPHSHEHRGHHHDHPGVAAFQTWRAFVAHYVLCYSPVGARHCAPTLLTNLRRSTGRIASRHLSQPRQGFANIRALIPSPSPLVGDGRGGVSIRARSSVG